MKVDIKNITQPLTEAQKNLALWIFNNVSVLDSEDEEEVHQLFSQISFIRRRIQELDGNIPIQ